MNKIDISPDIRRYIIRYANIENITFQDALQLIFFEGVKATTGKKSHDLCYVDNPVNKPMDNPVNKL